MTEFRIVVSKNILDCLDMKKFSKPIEWSDLNNYYFDHPSGKEHYRLLSYISLQLPTGTTIIDMGTFYGASSAALAANPNCIVKTFDIVNVIETKIDITKNTTIHDVKNIEIYIENYKEIPETLLASPLIFLDIDPHDGIQEVDFLQFLRDIGYQGIVITDDIHLNDAMNTMWNNVPERKKDITEYGHFTGTGIIYFSDKYKIDFV